MDGREFFDAYNESRICKRRWSDYPGEKIVIPLVSYLYEVQ